MLKKMMLLASMALAAIAFAVPASASALEWTDNGEALLENVETTASGVLKFGDPAEGKSKFGCVVHVGITAEPGETGTVTSFSPTTSTCTGEGSFAKCTLAEDSVTGLPAVVHITGTNTLTVTGPIVIHNHYSGSECPITKSTLTVADATITLKESKLTNMTLSGGAISHTTLVGGQELPPAEVGVFGGLTTVTDTLSIS